ncbi:glycosyltransferase family 2 protein [Rhizobium alvei]|uniref:Glycosyltransferase family 2 protein n=1 Tax=Rhizobium alvei TaxID=1132659 RepID=A0ABT8YJ09_9HYPH|nr:glycosyltransferase family 2 protein [Rhizobium alvei]MDO6963584.1 glycosyltransferase family 2 protein [Rhizobium alvei]
MLGFRYFCVIDNNSTDGTRGVIDEFRKRQDVFVVVISDYISQHYQDFKTTAAAKFAVEYFSSLGASIDWIVPLDADEFISFSSVDGSFVDILVNAREASVVTFPLINCASEVPLEHYKPGAVYDQFPLVDRRSTRSEVKCIYRFTSESRLFAGNHFVRNRVFDLADIYPATKLGAYYRHYPYRSIAHTRLKVINGYKSIVAFPDVKGGAHWRQNWELYNKHGEPWLSRYLERYIERVREQAS